MDNNLFTIKDLENLSGIKAHTIRIWEQRYTFLKPSRTTTNIRYYTSEELKIILNVSHHFIVWELLPAPRCLTPLCFFCR